MALVTCPECGGTVSSLARACPHCGYAVAESHSRPQTQVMTCNHCSGQGMCENGQDLLGIVYGPNSCYDCKKAAGLAGRTVKVKCAVCGGKGVLRI